MISQRGIEANPEKVEAIRRMQPPRNQREVQKLAGWLASLSSFISKSAEGSLPFFKALKTSKSFQWGQEQQQAFESLKSYLENLTVMTSPTPKAELLLYIASAGQAVSVALVEERKIEGAAKQIPIYFITKALSGSKLLYSEMEKMAYVVVMAARKLRHYFQSHKIIVPTSYPLKDMFENREASGRIGKWATQLADHTIDFISRSAIKSQVLADFIIDWTPTVSGQERPVLEVTWQLQCDSAYCSLGAGASAVIRAPSGTKLRYAVRLDFEGCTNNVAEYEGLLLGLRKARALGVRKLIIRTDSELISGQWDKSKKAYKPEMAKYLQAVRSMEKYFLGFTVASFPRAHNQEANKLAKAAALKEPLPPDVFFETLRHGLTQCDKDAAKFVNALASEDWRAPIMAYLQGHFIPEDEKDEKRMLLRARNSTIINEALYRKGVWAPLLKCISRSEGQRLLNEIHSGMCSSHIGTRVLVAKAFRHGFYWPSAVSDAQEVARTCTNCQKHAHYSKFCPSEVHLIPSVWPFARWGMDIVGPLPTAPGNYKFAAVAVEYFSKWIEVKPLRDITASTLQKFF